MKGGACRFVGRYGNADGFQEAEVRATRAAMVRVVARKYGLAFVAVYKSLADLNDLQHPRLAAACRCLWPPLPHYRRFPIVGVEVLYKDGSLFVHRNHSRPSFEGASMRAWVLFLCMGLHAVGIAVRWNR